ncbi:MAG: DUF1694 domain-containing protein [Fusobacteriaceae bacterium]
MQKDIIAAQEQAKKKFFETQIERKSYLDEFKENIIVSVNKEDVETGFIYPEIVEAMHEPDAILLKMRRDISLKYLKPYIQIAEKIKLRYTLIDGLSFVGDVGVVVVSKHAMDNEGNDTIVESFEEKFEKAGLPAYYAKHIGKKICKKHYEEIEKIAPIFKSSFEKLSIIERILGQSCPIDDEKRKG